MMNANQLQQTAQKQKSATITSLGGVAPFEQPSWEPQPYPGAAQPAGTPQAEPKGVIAETKTERELLEKPSLVFVRSNAAAPMPAIVTSANTASAEAQIGLAPGTRLRAYLEAGVSTAVQTPVVAVVEYNYERDGEIVVPAGARAFGHLEAADRSGYIGVHFDSMMFPDGSTVKFEAVATDLRLRPLKGKVEGKNTGKNILVRSAAGVGEIAATLVGRGSLNQPLSEGDMLRERVSDNIGQAADEHLTKLAISEHLAITLPAGAEIYIVLQKPAGASIAARKADANRGEQLNPQSVQQLRELLQLQKELEQASPTANSN
jgi:hypothetical protein